MEVDKINQLGKNLELYTLIDYIGKGFPIILPRGSKIIEIVKDYLEKIEEKNGYLRVQTPEVSLAEIYKIEDRFENVKEKLFIINEEDNNNSLILKQHSRGFYCSIYKTNQHSYRELPIKYAETSIVFNNERDIKGITKTRQRMVEDLCVFSQFNRIEEIIREMLIIELDILKRLGLDLKFKIYTWDTNRREDYIGRIEEWDYVVKCFSEAMEKLEIKYEIEPIAKMYGPSIVTEFKKTKFQTIQADFEISHRFDLKYKTEDNREDFPLCINCSPVGNYEKLIRILIEKYDGNFPFWLAPEQVRIIYNGEGYEEYVEAVVNQLKENNLRVNIDKTIANYAEKINRAQELKIPYILTINKEMFNKNKICVNGKEYKIEKFIEEVLTCKTKY